MRSFFERQLKFISCPSPDPVAFFDLKLSKTWYAGAANVQVEFNHFRLVSSKLTINNNYIMGHYPWKRIFKDEINFQFSLYLNLTFCYDDIACRELITSAVLSKNKVIETRKGIAEWR